MAEHNILGIDGEALAAEFLQNKGFKILSKNWRFRKAEIDIIAKKEEFLVFVEVKTRSTAYFGAPSESVTLKKQQLMAEAAEAYLEEFKIEDEIRFDILSIIKSGKTLKIEHIPSAFTP